MRTQAQAQTHYEMSQQKKRSGRECAAHDMTFGGRCLNCGFGACPSRDTPPGAPHLYRGGVCVFCQEVA